VQKIETDVIIVNIDLN